jgi:hypothetical protein
MFPVALLCALFSSSAFSRTLLPPLTLSFRSEGLKSRLFDGDRVFAVRGMPEVMP